MMVNVLLVALLGLPVATYAFFLEWKLDRDPDYKPVCDLADIISCKRNFGNKQVPILGIPSSWIMFVYLIPMIILAYLNQPQLAFGLAIFGAVGSVYKEYRIVKYSTTFCPVCNAFFAVAFVLLYLTYQYI